MIDYIEQKTIVSVPVVVSLAPGTRVDNSRETVMYADATHNTWYTCALAANHGLITVQRIGD